MTTRKERRNRAARYAEPPKGSTPKPYFNAFSAPRPAKPSHLLEPRVDPWERKDLAEGTR